jgi:iron complex transport system substrate-binding protein
MKPRFEGERLMRTRHLLALLLALAPVAAQSTEKLLPQRIVSTAPSITELLYALGLGEQVVGVDRFSRYPPEAARKARIGDYAAPNLEAIAALQPTLVIIPTNPVQLRQRLEALKLRVLELDQEGLGALYRSFREVGNATGTAARAEKLVAEVRGGLAAIRARAAARKPARAMFVVGRAPGGLEGLMVAGAASYLNEIMEIAGGANVFADARAAYPKVSLEEVLARNPEVIIDMGEMGETVGVSPAQKRRVEALWKRLETVNAVRKGRVHAVAEDIFVVPGPRVVEAAAALFQLFHPEAP